MASAKNGSPLFKTELMRFVGMFIQMPKASAMRSLNLVTMDCKCAVGELLDCKNFGTLSRLLRVTVQVLRAVKKFKEFEEQHSYHSFTRGVG